jgi:hypothetical protein
MISVPAEEHNIHITYITTYLPSSAHAFNVVWTTLHMLRERIHVLRKRPQDLPRSTRPRCAVVISHMTDTQPLPHDRDCPQANLILRGRSEIHITRWEDIYILTFLSVRRYKKVNHRK